MTTETAPALVPSGAGGGPGDGAVADGRAAPGLYPGMTRSDYDALPAVNISRLVAAISHGEIDPAKFSLDPDPETDAQRIGSVAHLALFEPELCEARVCVLQAGVDGRTKEGKALSAAARESGQYVVKAHEWAGIVSMRDALRRQPLVAELLAAPGRGEMSFVWTDAETGLICKGRVDRFCNWTPAESGIAWPVVIDLKTTTCAARHAFIRHILDHGYHVRAAWYLDGLNAVTAALGGEPLDRRFVWLAAEKDAPYSARVYEPDEMMLQRGGETWRKLLRAYAECRKNKHWPAYDGATAPEPLSLPSWA